MNWDAPPPPDPKVVRRREDQFGRRFRLTLEAAFRPKADLQALYRILPIAERELGYKADLKATRARLRGIRWRLMKRKQP